MPEKPSVEWWHQHCLALIEISEQVVRDSELMDAAEKRDYLGDYQENRRDAQAYLDQRNPAYLRQLADEVLTPWNESSDEDSDAFFRLAAERGIELERKDYLGTVLARGRIANIEEYEVVVDSIVIWQQDGRIDAAQAQRLSEMVGAYEAKRR